ncbi:MAG: hypothetical protein RIQ60_2896 [Pseudomonadota bacterium]
MVVDKFARHALRCTPGPVLGLPLVHGCVAWLELRHLPEAHTELHTLHHLGGGVFAVPSRTVVAALPPAAAGS